MKKIPLSKKAKEKRILLGTLPGRGVPDLKIYLEGTRTKRIAIREGNTLLPYEVQKKILERPDVMIRLHERGINPLLLKESKKAYK